LKLNILFLFIGLMANLAKETTKKYKCIVHILEVFIVVRYDAPVRGRGTLNMPQSAAWQDGMMPQSSAGEP
jgi:hypothetical protein